MNCLHLLEISIKKYMNRSPCWQKMNGKTNISVKRYECKELLADHILFIFVCHSCLTWRYYGRHMMSILTYLWWNKQCKWEVKAFIKTTFCGTIPFEMESFSLRPKPVKLVYFLGYNNNQQHPICPLSKRLLTRWVSWSTKLSTMASKKMRNGNSARRSSAWSTWWRTLKKLRATPVPTRDMKPRRRRMSARRKKSLSPILPPTQLVAFAAIETSSR